MTKQEQAFWDYYNPIEEMAEKYGVEVYTIVNFRQIFDYAYVMGKTEGVNEMYAIATKNVGGGE